MTRKIVIFGGNGFLGEALADRLGARNVEVVLVAVDPVRVRPGHRWVSWDGSGLGSWVDELSGAHAIVQLPQDWPETPADSVDRQEQIRTSVEPVRLVGDARARVDMAPRVWVQVSPLAIHGDTGDVVIDDFAEPAGDTSGPEVAVGLAWEQAYRDVTASIDRRVLLRNGMPIGGEDPVLDRLIGLARAGFGGSVGDGRQWVSWIALEDLVAVVVRAIDDPQMHGTYNVTAPNPVTNQEAMAILRASFSTRKIGLPLPGRLVQLGARLAKTDARLMLTGRRCIPQRLLDEGFVFRTTDFADAIAKASESAAHGPEPIDRDHDE